MRVAIVDVDGLILNAPFVGPLSVGENPVSLFREKLDAISADVSVKAIVLRINSPGGGVAACNAMRADLERFKAAAQIPVIACLMDTGTGGSYYLASACDHIVATPGCVTGGVGVILNLFNLRDLMSQFNIIPQPIKAGESIDIGSSARVLSDDDKKIFQSMADEYHTRMKGEIARSRPQIRGENTFDGRIFTANQAIERGLVDRVGELDTAISTRGECGMSFGMYRQTRSRPVSPHQRPSPFHLCHYGECSPAGSGAIAECPGFGPYQIAHIHELVAA